MFYINNKPTKTKMFAMSSRRNKKYDILAVGELLIDFISTDFADNLDEVHNFKRLQGGSPANMCMNMARLGNRSKLLASLGNDDMGHYLLKYVQSLGVDCHNVRSIDIPTTLILVTRSRNVSNFEAYRGADCEIIDEQFPASLFDEIALFHTTCFALSKEPAQSSIMRAARLAVQKGCQLSIDANYARKIWRDQQQAQQIVSEYCGLGALVKVSEVDWERLYDSKLADPEKAATHFLELGASEACITMGSEGCYVANQEGGLFLPARKVEVKDTTGAGDAFWSGYLTAWLDNEPLINRAKAGRRMAELKLAHFGPLPQRVPREEVYADF